MTKVFDSSLCEPTFFGVHFQTDGIYRLKHTVKVLVMIVPRLWVQSNVADVCTAIILVVAQYLVHDTLEGCRCVFKTIRHHLPSVKTARSCKGDVCLNTHAHLLASSLSSYPEVKCNVPLQRHTSLASFPSRRFHTLSLR